MSHDAKHTCPRRTQGDGKSIDRWIVRTGNPNMLGHRQVCCTYCGSLDPNVFMEYVRIGYTVGPTDKSYKAYLSAPLSEQELEEYRQAWLAGPIAHALETNDDSVSAELQRSWQDECKFLEGKTVAKFYFQHLSAEQRLEFIDLANSGRMKIGQPGCFYVKPFFCR